jgi:hypothetical protein
MTAGGDRPLGVRRPRLVPLSADEERRAVGALANLLAPLLADHGGRWEDGGDREPDDHRPDDGEGA